MSIGSPTFAMNLSNSAAKIGPKGKAAPNPSNQVSPDKGSDLFQQLVQQFKSKSSLSSALVDLRAGKQQDTTNKDHTGTSNLDVNQQLLALMQILQQLQQSMATQTGSISSANQTKNISVKSQLDTIQNLLGQLTTELQKGSLQTPPSKTLKLDSPEFLKEWNQVSASLLHLIDSGAASRSVVAGASGAEVATVSSAKGTTGAEAQTADLNTKINQVLQSMRSWMTFEAGAQHSNSDSSMNSIQSNPMVYTQISIRNHLQQSMDSGSNHTSSGQDQDSHTGVHSDASMLLTNTTAFQSLTNSKPVDATVPGQSFAQHFGQLLDSNGITSKTGLMDAKFGEKDFRIKLVPEGLGEIHVVIQAKDTGLSVQFAASSDQARQLLDAQSMQLRNQLSERGFQLDQIQVTNLPSSLSFTFSQSDQQGRNGGPSQQKPQKQGVLELDPLEANYSSYLDRSLVTHEPSELDSAASIDTIA